MKKKHHTHTPAQFDIQTLMDDIKTDGIITRGFNQTNTDNRIKIFDEYRNNLEDYLEYAHIFHDEPKDAQDLTHHAFISAYEQADQFLPDQDIRFWLFSHMQEQLESAENQLFMTSRQIIEGTTPNTSGRTIGETMHLFDIQRELSKVLASMKENEINEVLDFMRDLDETCLSDNVRQKLLENNVLKDLHFDNYTHD
ncbi:MAG: hypothetical protein ACRBCK_07470 [Alphaproteobacteria bacterium]